MLAREREVQADATLAPEEMAVCTIVPSPRDLMLSVDDFASVWLKPAVDRLDRIIGPAAIFPPFNGVRPSSQDTDQEYYRGVAMSAHLAPDGTITLSVPFSRVPAIERLFESAA